MAKSLKKKAPTKKTTTIKKGPAKKVAKPAAAPPAKSGFMWKLLEKKQAELKRRQDAHHGEFRDKDGNLHPREQSFAKFSGPRRRAV